MSQFTVPLFVVGKVEKHPNADSLSITEVEGCPVIFRTGDFQEGEEAIYVPVEAVVPLDNPAFSFLSTKEGQKTHRVKAKKLRGVFSMGLLMKPTIIKDIDALGLALAVLAGEEVPDCASLLGIVKYVEPEKNTNMKLGAGNRERSTPDSATAPVYDVESFRKYKDVFVDGEAVVVTEKIHGCNARFVFRKADDEEAPRLFVGSRNFFNRKSPESVWWKIATRYDLETKLAAYPDMVLYGEVFGQVQDLKYGTTAEDPLRFAAFDIYDKAEARFLDYSEFVEICKKLEVPMAPVLYAGPYNYETIKPLCDGPSTFDDKQIREGFVIRPMVERWNRSLGRVQVKLVGEAYHLRKGGTEFQ